MENKLQCFSLLENKHWRSLYVTSVSNTRNDGLSILFDKLVRGRAVNALLTGFRSIIHHKIHSPVSGHDPVKKEIVTGIIMATFFMKGCAKTVTTTVNAPFTRVKLLLQNQGELIKSGRLLRPYRGITDCFIRTVKNEGVISLWRGNSVNLSRIFPSLVITPVFVSISSRFVYKSREERYNVNNDKKLFLKNLAFDAVVIVFSSACLYPLEFAHTRLANDVKCGDQRKFEGLLDVYRRTLRSDGIVGIYRGISIAGVGLISALCCSRWLAFNASSTDTSKKQKKSYVPLEWRILAVTRVVYYPFQTVYKRMMMTSGEADKYKSSFDAFARIIKKEGFHSLFKGFGAGLLCLVPGYCLQLLYQRLDKRNKLPFGGISVVIERQ